MNTNYAYNINSDLLPKDTAIYLRLSDEEKHKRNSDSIDNQKMILLDYAHKLHLNVVKVYADEHVTGSTFNRPVFKKMIDDIEKGIINCVLVTDLSRLGREHIEADYYLEKYFPSKGVRFITYRGGLDSYLDPARMNEIDIPLENALNEETVKHTSAITKATLKIMQKDGKYITGRPPYGYLKDPNNKYKLIIDENTYKTVKYIYKEFLRGISFSQIARNLNDKNILSPASYFHKIKNGEPRLGSIWTVNVIRGILVKSTIYTGNMEQGKTFSFNHKVKKRYPLPQEKWIIVKNTHNPIIDSNTEKLTKEMLKKVSRTRSVESRQNRPAVFSSLIYCKECGKPMTTTSSSYKGKKTYRKYVCSSYKKYGKEMCDAHLISEEAIHDGVLFVLNALINNLCDIEKVMRTQQIQIQKKTILKLNQKIDNAKTEISRYKELKLGLYDDYKNEIISLSDYKFMNEKYEKAIENFNKDVADIENEKNTFTNNNHIGNKYVEMFKSFKGITKIDRMLAIKLIERITIDKYKKIEVQFKFDDPIRKYLSYK